MSRQSTRFSICRSRLQDGPNSAQRKLALSTFVDIQNLVPQLRSQRVAAEVREAIQRTTLRHRNVSRIKKPVFLDLGTKELYSTTREFRWVLSLPFSPFTHAEKS